MKPQESSLRGAIPEMIEIKIHSYDRTTCRLFRGLLPRIFTQIKFLDNGEMVEIGCGRTEWYI